MINPNQYEQKFFDLYPQYKLIFPKLHKDKNGSNIMWAIALLVHPDSSFWFVPYEERKVEISKVLSVPLKYLDDDILVNRFKNSILTFKEKYLSNWKFKLEERDALLMSIPFDLDNILDLTKNLAEGKKLWDTYNKAEEEFQRENQAHVHGGTVESAQEAGKI